jgi:DNA integrity scanning protein DisA with diadenylate cyclase activity
MKFEVLIQNVFILFIVAIIIEICVMAVFSMTAVKDMSETRPVQVARDTIVLLLAVVLCYKVDVFDLFAGTGIKLHKYLGTAISALVLVGLTNLVSDFFSKFRRG